VCLCQFQKYVNTHSPVSSKVAISFILVKATAES